MVDITRSDLITGFWGEWPDFHDAELRCLCLESPGNGVAHVEATFDVIRFSGQRDENGSASGYHRGRVTMRFEDAEALIIDGGFGSQNVLNALVLRARTDEERRSEAGGDHAALPYFVEFVPIPGFCNISFLCAMITVLRVEEVAPAA